jgi:4-carboxymuconolactone decarboxylase
VTRLAPVPFEEWDTDAISVIMGGRPLVPSNVLGLFANHPALAKAFLTWNGYLLSRATTIAPRIRELAILRIAWRRRCRYEWAQHVPIARKAGVTDAEIARVRAGASGEAGGDVVGLVIAAVDELDARAELTDETYQALTGMFDARQVMDLVFTAGTYGVLAMAFNTFGLELEPGLSDEGFDTTAATDQH